MASDNDRSDKMLNKQKGNMYAFVTHTWNPITGKCIHDCVYCYMKVFPQKEIHLNNKALIDDLGSGNFIFIGSSTDMFAENVPKEWIESVLQKCANYDNIYLFQSKNPERFFEFNPRYPKNTIFGTTIETNRDTSTISKAPSVHQRTQAMLKAREQGFKTMVTIEPILDFDIEPLVRLLKLCKPEWVNIGADSKHHKLPEPSKEKIEQLIKELSVFTQVKPKDNLKRLMQ